MSTMTITDPARIPATPHYTITVATSGDATLDGAPVHAVPGQAPRVAALAEVRVKAALHGRAVRVTAKEPDGTVWPLLVDTDGTVTTLDQPNPMPASPPAAALPVETPQSAIGPSQQPDVLAAVPAEWAAPLPSALTYRLQWAQLLRQEQAGALVEAVITAHRIETTLTEEFGPAHPHTINLMTVRAWLTLRIGAEAELAETIELLVETAERRREAAAQPEEDTARLARNAHALWRRLTAEDPESAREQAERLLVLLVVLDDGRRSGDVIRWVESGGAARGAA
ncbi:hypothetical protein [Streptomyces klenkii]